VILILNSKTIATPIKETPILKGKSVHVFLDNLTKEPKKVSKKELEVRKTHYTTLESIRTF